MVPWEDERFRVCVYSVSQICLRVCAGLFFENSPLHNVLKIALGRHAAHSRHCYVGMGLLQDALADIQEITNLEGGPFTSFYKVCLKLVASDQYDVGFHTMIMVVARLHNCKYLVPAQMPTATCCWQQ